MGQLTHKTFICKRCQKGTNQGIMLVQAYKIMLRLDDNKMQILFPSLSYFHIPKVVDQRTLSTCFGTTPSTKRVTFQSEMGGI